MYTYNIISTSPYISSFPTCINGLSIGSALKDLIKVYHNYKINELILADQSHHWKANMKYYNKNGRSRVNIGYDVYPRGYLGIKNEKNSVSMINLNPLQNMNMNNNFNNATLTESSVLMPIVPTIFDMSRVNLTGL